MQMRAQNNVDALYEEQPVNCTADSIGYLITGGAEMCPLPYFR